MTHENNGNKQQPPKEIPVRPDPKDIPPKKAD